MGKRRSSFVASDDSDHERPAKVSKVKKGSSSSGGGPGVDSEGNAFWEVCYATYRGSCAAGQCACTPPPSNP